MSVRADRDLLRSGLVEDLNRLACPAEQERFSADPARARDALDRLRFLDASELPRYHARGALTRRERDLIEQFFAFARDRLTPIPRDLDPVVFTRAHPGWQSVRERAFELLAALDAFVDIGVPGWGHQFRS